MKHYYLPENGNFYKSNLHCHSDYSDGKLTPQQLKELYKSNGYSVLAITDHEGIFDHGYLDDEDFLTIPGYEREINGKAEVEGVWDTVKTCHLCFYPKDRNNVNCSCFDPDFFHPKFRWMRTPELKEKITYLGEPYTPEYSAESINHVIAEANKNGFLVTLNHLTWSQERYEQFSQYKGMFATEIWNTGCREENSQFYDMMLKLGNRIYCVAADDNHNSAPVDSQYSDSLGGWVMIKTDALKHDSIIGALERGEFYASTGPEINVLYSEDGKLHIETSPVKQIKLFTGKRHTANVIAKEGEFVNCADFDISNIYGYFRVEITDEHGKKAYTNAVFVED